MPRLHALELLPDDTGAEAVRRDWTRLREAGLASQLDHPGPTNTPHVTVVAAPDVSGADERRAADLLGPLLPVSVRASGLAVLGGRRITLVRLVDVDDEVVRAVLDLRRGMTGLPHPGWLPHLTLARRVPREQVQQAVDVLGHEDVVLRLTQLRRWDPEAPAVRTIVGGSTP